MITKKQNPKKVAKATEVEKPVIIEQPAQQSQPSNVMEIKVAEIVPNPANPRKYFDEENLSELAQNIHEHGIFQPVTVREVPEESGKKYEIVFGERRFRAAKIVGLETIPCIVRNLTDDDAFDMMVSENLQRQDIRPSEEGRAFKSILERGYSIAYISERFGKSETFIHSRLSLIRLIPEITVLLNREEISIGMAVEIARLEPEIQENLYKEHLDSEIEFNNWKNLPLKVFKEKLETTYTVQLSRFSFDRTECDTCTYNSEVHSLFPVLENSRCTRSSCLANKQEKYMLDCIIAAVGDENLDVYISNGNNGNIQTDIVKKLGELGIEVKYGNVYKMPENPVMPLEENFPDNPSYGQAMKDFRIELSKCNNVQGLIANGLACKVIMIENLTPVPGYIMIKQEKESVKANPKTQNTPENSTGSDKNNADDSLSAPIITAKNSHVEVKPDLLSTLQKKDMKNREEALEKIIDDAINLITNTDIPPVETTPFEETLINFIMLSFLNRKYYDFFSIPEGQSMTEEFALGIYSTLTQEQKNLLKRNFLIKYITIKNGISKRAALLIELAKHHFPEKMAEIEKNHNDEYQKKWEVIKAQIDKIESEKKEVQKVA